MTRLTVMLARLVTTHPLVTTRAVDARLYQPPSRALPKTPCPAHTLATTVQRRRIALGHAPEGRVMATSRQLPLHYPCQSGWEPVRLTPPPTGCIRMIRAQPTVTRLPEDHISPCTLTRRAEVALLQRLPTRWRPLPLHQVPESMIISLKHAACQQLKCRNLAGMGLYYPVLAENYQHLRLQPKNATLIGIRKSNVVSRAVYAVLRIEDQLLLLKQGEAGEWG